MIIVICVYMYTHTHNLRMKGSSKQPLTVLHTTFFPPDYKSHQMIGAYMFIYNLPGGGCQLLKH